MRKLRRNITPYFPFKQEAIREVGIFLQKCAVRISERKRTEKNLYSYPQKKAYAWKQA